MRRPGRQVLITFVAALAGLCAATALAVLTSDLSTQRIGLAGESPTVGRKLVAAPAASATTGAAATRPRRPHTTTPVPPPRPGAAVVAPAAPPSAGAGATRPTRPQTTTPAPPSRSGAADDHSRSAQEAREHQQGTEGARDGDD